MNLYAFELGRKSMLALAELTALLGEDNLIEKGHGYAIFELSKIDSSSLSDIIALQDSLGGTIKIIEILSTSSKSSLENDIEKILLSDFQNHSGKIPFAISILGYTNNREINIKLLLNFSKKILKSLNLNSRFINKGNFSPPSATLYKARVLEKGIDLCIIKGKSSLYLGKTVTLQDINSYTLRDFGKPVRDARIGMLPPKLAQIMINLAGPNTKTIFDPFCGTGTILTEGLLMDKTVVGSDFNERMVSASERNCEWLIDEFRLKDASYRVFFQDATKLTKADLPEKIDAIITEGFLGEALTREPNEDQKQRIFDELTTLHSAWLKKIHALTPKNCPVIMCTTAFKIQNKTAFFPNFDLLAENAGYTVDNFYLYDRPDQIVARDIKVLKKD